MRKLGLSLFTVTSLSLAACGGGPDIYSPSDPREFDRSMIDEQAVSGLDAAERAYVMGHGIGVYLMGKTLPEYVGHTGYAYRPGSSSPHAQFAYQWEDVLVARSGGVDGTGGAIYHDDVSIDDSPDPQSDPGDNPDTDYGDPFDDVTPGDGDDDPDGPGNDAPDDPNDGDGDCTLVAEYCSDFLVPATVDAVNLGVLVDATRFLDPGLTGQQAEAFVAEFRRGLNDALELPEGAPDVAESLYVKDALMREGVCWL